MSQTRILLDLTFAGGSPLIAGDRLRTMSNIERLIRGLKHGSHQRAIGGAVNSVKTTPTIVAASATCTVAAPASSATVTIAGQALTSTQTRARGTLTCVSAIAGDTVVVNGYTFVGTAGAVTLGALTFSIDSSDTATAASLAAQIPAYGPLSQTVAAKSAVGVCTVIAQAEGTSGNSITLATTGGTITRSAATLTSGAAPTNNVFDNGSTNALIAASLARAVNASTTAAVQQVTAASDGVSVVTFTSVLGGVGGNAITLTSSSNSTLAVTGSGFLASGSQGATTTLVF